MLIPYKDLNPTKRFPIITILLILSNIAIFLFQIFGKFGFNNITTQFGLIPIEIYSGVNLPDSDYINPYLSIITFNFIHGNLLHVAFNMLFLWVFGNNVEDKMSLLRFTSFYMLTGIISGIAFAISTPSMEGPLIGASGAISGILGAYLFMFPMAKVYVLIFIIRIKMPAIIFIVLWFVPQIFGFFENNGSGNNVAWIAHISGFISGIFLFKFFTIKSRE